MKKDTPLAILKAIEPFLPDVNSNNLVVDKSAGVILKIVDSDKESNLFFEITSSEARSDGVIVLKVKYRPHTDVNPGTRDTHIDIKNFESTFNRWLSLVEGYNTVKSIYDDPITKKYADDFYQEFQSADEDAGTVSFTLKQQLLLDSALTQVIHVLEAKKDDTNKEAVSELIEQAEEIQNTVTESTKQETLTKLSKLFAKVQKLGIKFIKDVYPIVQKEVIGAAIKSAAEHLPTIMHHLP